MEALPEETTDLVRNSSLCSEFMAEREEILRHKWIESEKTGADIGFERAWSTGLLSTAPLGASSVKPFGKRDLFERSWADSQLECHRSIQNQPVIIESKPATFMVSKGLGVSW
jgi:hypothetical protein